MTVETLQWTFLASALPVAERDTCTPDTTVPHRRPSPSVESLGAPDASTGDTELVAAIGRALLEVLTGRRPVTQLSRWIAPESLDRLAAAIRVGRWTRVRLRSSRASRTGENGLLGRCCFECDGRPMVGSMRVEVRGRRWRCTHFTLLLPGSQVRTRD
jgi:hypothetical protein